MNSFVVCCVIYWEIIRLITISSRWHVPRIAFRWIIASKTPEVNQSTGNSLPAIWIVWMEFMTKTNIEKIESVFYFNRQFILENGISYICLTIVYGIPLLAYCLKPMVSADSQKKNSELTIRMRAANKFWLFKIISIWEKKLI